MSIFDALNLSISPVTAEHIALPVSFFIITLLHIVFGELAPKSIAITYPLDTTLFVSKPMRLFYYIFKPLIRIFNNLSNFILRVVGIPNASEHTDAHTEEEIKLLLTESEEHGKITETSNELIQNVFEFDDRTVQHIYTPRSKACMIDIEDSLEDIIKIIKEE